MVSKDDDEVDERGLPLQSSYDGRPAPSVMYPLFTSVFMAIAQGVAWFIYSSNPTYSSKIALLATHDLGWIFVGVVGMKLGFSLGLGVILGEARKAAKINVPDQQVYSVYTKPGAPKLGYVLMEKDGALGKFNRAQRAYQNYLESAPFVVAYFLLAGFVFPFPTFCLGSLFTIARIVAAIGYVSSPDGRMAGNIIGMLFLSMLEGLVLFAGLKMLKVV